MLDSLYTIATWGLIGVTFILGIYFFSLSVPPKTSLKNYVIARNVMACAYISFGILTLIEYFFQSDDIDLDLFRFSALFISLSQAFLFTYTLITLINVYFVTKKKIILEITPIFFFLILGLISFYNPQSIPINLLLNIFTLYYISLLIRYTYIFIKNYQNTIIQIDNFYADHTIRLRWILISFIAALSLGIMALLLALLYSFTRGIIFTILSICFYTIFGIRFINYAFLFQKVELLTEDYNYEPPISNTHYTQLQTNIQQWINKKQFTQPEINIKQVAKQLNTNRTYLSNYINTHERKTFRAWINNLRIEEAKKVMLEHPQLPIHEICDLVGFSDKSNFGKQFAIYTGKPPKAWLKSQIKT